jgi:toll-interacting protein
MNADSNSFLARELFTEEDLNELCEMFPNIERQVIQSILEVERGNKERTVSALLELTE